MPGWVLIHGPRGGLPWSKGQLRWHSSQADKIKSIQDAPQPQYVTGLLSYYGNLLSNMSKILAQLYSMCYSKRATGEEGKETTFEHVLQSDTLLVYHNLRKKLVDWVQWFTAGWKTAFRALTCSWKERLTWRHWWLCLWYCILSKNSASLIFWHPFTYNVSKGIPKYYKFNCQVGSEANDRAVWSRNLGKCMYVCL